MTKSKILYRKDGRGIKSYTPDNVSGYGSKWRIRYDLVSCRVTTETCIDPNWPIEDQKVLWSAQWIYQVLHRIT